ncbi:mitochondrial translation initiation factor, putative [Talaromyces stipitatus ATCC 10500]|uniref:Translation initiation factor IF-2, mitochondrial n=1 Tax=Talaromyces stipitatus (strain ATCC 10500 / CBS 375.48 / QM 6759 / NRRL 1006) TaxID=441959 RepID=B8LUM4_TALSN|nr:mitochondrial translation initiation factor, putative [Talaromyces stipitatus ATCC 10500]EED23881.1 mitochondrial translation initiation factor, putative [Talaromyces stipitatus ATCC 10500]
MHRRVCRRICRCPSFDSGYPTPATTRRSCRDFHLSSSYLQSDSQTTRGTGENEGESTSSQATPRPLFKPKFGGAWGAKLSTPKASGLTAAELASRNALKAATPAPPPPPPSELPKSEIESVLVTQKPVFRRTADWICPQCLYNCFGKHPFCPKCRTPNPNPPLHPLPEPKHDPQIRKVNPRKLGEDIINSWRKDNVQPRNEGSSVNMRKITFQPPERRLSIEETEELVKDEKQPEKASPEKEEAKTAESEPKTAKEGKQEVNEFDKWLVSLEELKKAEELQKAQKAQRSEKAKDARRGRSRDSEEEEFDPEERRQRREKRKQKKKPAEVVEPQRSPLYLPEFISVSNLADVLGVRQAEFIDHLEEIGFEGVIHSHVLDAETAGLIAEEYNFEPIFETSEQDLVAAPEPEDKSHLPQRPPVVTIMGHVDHGKTTLLDWLRKSSVAASEHGGITQHIGAFSVVMPSGKSITFLDTPGHAAFLDMRRRGADLTDIVVLVVAADDSVKPQTIEAIKHAKQANVPMIVAINKMDKDNVNPEKVKQDLARHSVDVEDYGGDVQAIPVSGKTGLGMLDLEEAIVTLSELLDHRADVEGNAEGWVVEATTKKAGRVATVLVKRGTVRAGDILVAGTTWTRIKTLKNEAGTVIEEATPGMPVEIDGWREQPEAGSEVLQAPSEQRAKDVVDYRLERSDIKKLGQDTAAINVSRRETLEQRRRSADDETVEETETSTGPKLVNFIIKADVSGSVEAVVNSVSGIGNNEVLANILRSGVGQVSEFDIKHAATSEASIINFNAAVDPMISRMAEAQGVRLMNHNIIYELIDDVKAKLSEHLPPNITYRVTGEAEITQQFEITVKGRNKNLIAGCKVRNGVISRGKKVRVLRDKEIIYEGSLTSLRNVKKDVTEMRKDTECGLSFQDWVGFQIGDHVQSYEEVVEKRYLH